MTESKSTDRLFDIPESAPGVPLTACTAGRCGTGPPGETCGSCRHLCRVGYHDQVYLKCGLMEHAWTHGGGSDIRAKWPACEKWEAAHAR